MEKFSSLNVGDQFQSTTTISSDELDEYLGFSRIKNAMFEIDTGKKEPKVVSGRAMISRMEGEFTRLRQNWFAASTLRFAAVRCRYGVRG